MMLVLWFFFFQGIISPDYIYVTIIKYSSDLPEESHHMPAVKD